MEQLSSHWMDFHEFDFWSIFEKLLRKFKSRWNVTIITATSLAENIQFGSYLAQFFLKYFRQKV